MKRDGQVAECELPDQTGTVRRLASLLADGPIVVLSHPAAMTPGCTKEACHSRDLASEFGEKRGLLGKLMPVKRTNSFIDTDRTVLDVIASELSMDSHADEALEVLRSQ